MLIQRLGQFFIRRMAKAHGFMDPMGLLSVLSRFSQPSEIAAPTELLRAGAIFHARGLVNSQAIQHNLDWVWPFWVEKQFDPNDLSFVPRAFSATHINLTHRNWTAAGLPDSEHTPLVDPRGLVTPFWDGWSIDAWIVRDGDDDLIPSRLENIEQSLLIDDHHKVLSNASDQHSRLFSQVQLIRDGDVPICCIDIKGHSDLDSRLVVSLRPYNPEGISLINDIAMLEDHSGWLVDKQQKVYFDPAPDHYSFSNYRQGDVYNRLREGTDKKNIHCPVGLATAAAVFDLPKNKTRDIRVMIPLEGIRKYTPRPVEQRDGRIWSEALKSSCRISIPQKHFEKLYESSIHTVLMHTNHNVYAGPYTYKRFWFRDAAFITYALICCGFYERAERIIDKFDQRQTIGGYFQSQEGEWDSNGQVLWLIQQYCRMTDQKPKERWKDMIYKGTRWIIKKRLKDDKKHIHSGLMPAGFSAEHFGPNDYYYWDDFWSIAGLLAVSELSKDYGDQDLADMFLAEAHALQDAVERSLQEVAHRIGSLAMPSSPYRRLDSASVGSLVEGYPLQLNIQKETRLLDTAKFLTENCLVSGGFFHDMSHSGINPYLTLHIAQVLLRAGDAKFMDLMEAIANLASPTGQWPEAIHPATKGGCMGDGQHVWAAAEWIMMLRNCFVREEQAEKKLILLSGIPQNWYQKGEELTFGPTSTIYGTISLRVKTQEDGVHVEWDARWHGEEPRIEIHHPETMRVILGQAKSNVDLRAVAPVLS